MSLNILSTTLLLAGSITASVLPRAGTELKPLMTVDFPDPAVIGIGNGAWLSFATNGNGKRVQVTKTTSGLGGPWNLLDNDLLPTVGSWSTGHNTWAPNVRRVGSKYVLYYVSEAKDGGKHCVAAAVSDTVLGPYKPDDNPIACHKEKGGAIDISGFTDSDGKNYVVYKIDGNSIGPGGSCGNSNYGSPGSVPTPLMLQEMGSDGTTRVGEPVHILDKGPYDGPLIEAPQIIKKDGLYIVFFSSNCYSTTLYDISYATSTSLRGPYKKAAKPLAVTGNPFDLTAPGGAQATDDGRSLVFHADCQVDGGKKRCLYTKDIKIEGGIVRFV
ncbi:hypothetical protein HYALB_00000697 [Hymenoscyphus albidus]|uniref:Glycoside hydrolase family 43 protein n=1 Tax=Hymenoscyphus albidus TaxID=595503 RepID=A0A9N9LRD8_9HELO|nr:hypothetical protein HYALB_00000697 [Hymenoscyphus albidus]